MHPLPLATAVALAAFLVVRRRRLGRALLGAGAAAAAGLALWGVGVIDPPNITKLIEDVGRTLGPWTYLLVGALAYLETGAFVGLIAPGETAVLVGGVVAGQGEISVVALIGLVWTCAVAGDLTSYMLGRRLGRSFLVRHGPRLKITERRLEQVEGFFARRGGVTILIGRFIGLVRAIAPFLAGASHMQLRTFLPYDVLGAGLWAATFSLLGYLFWQSLDRVTQWVGRGTFAFGAVVALVVAGIYGRRYVRMPRVRAWLEEGRMEIGLEAATLLALASVGLFTFLGLAELLETRPILPLDAQAFTVLGAVYTRTTGDVASVLTDVGSLPVTACAVLATAVWAVRRGHLGEGVMLVLALAATWGAVHIAKAAEDRPRPAASHVDTVGQAYPSGHSAYAIAFIACAVVLARAESRLAARFAVVGIAAAIAAAVGASRVYLRAHYLSDVVGGFALATAIFALGGLATLVVGFVRDNRRA